MADPDATLDPFLLRQAVASVAPPNFALKTRGDAIEVMECILEQIHQAGDGNGHCTPCLTHEMFAYQYMRYQKCDSCGHEEIPGRAEAYGLQSNASTILSAPSYDSRSHEGFFAG